MLVQLQGREVWYLQLNEAVSRRLVELMQERGHDAVSALYEKRRTEVHHR